MRNTEAVLQRARRAWVERAAGQRVPGARRRHPCWQSLPRHGELDEVALRMGLDGVHAARADGRRDGPPVAPMLLEAFQKCALLL
eukprot:38228-Chlamydomonas_euryale.AAC.3